MELLEFLELFASGKRAVVRKSWERGGSRKAKELSLYSRAR